MGDNTPPTKRCKVGNAAGSDLFQSYYLQFLEEEGVRPADDGQAAEHGGISRNSSIDVDRTLFSPATN